MNIAEILKDCPKGTELYSPIFGTLLFDGIHYYKDFPYPITTRDCKGNSQSFMEDGRFYDTKGAKCMLFPSEENSDWNTFKKGEI